MDTLQKKSSFSLSKHYYSNNIYRHKRYRLLNRKKKNIKRIFKLNFKNKKIVYHLVKRIYLKKKYRFFYSKHRLDSIRFKKYLFSYSRYMKRKLWRKKLKIGFKKFFGIFLKKISKIKKFAYYRLIYTFYKTHHFYKLLKSFVKYSRLKKILKKKGRVFKAKKKVYIVKLITQGRAGELSMVFNLLQMLISCGKKKLASKLSWNFYTLLKFKFKELFVEKYLEFLEKTRPLVYYKTMYISGKKYKVPILMPIRKSYLVAIRWLINSPAFENSSYKIFTLVVESLKNEGALIKNRKDHHALIFENKSYTRFLRFLKRGF